MHYGQHLIKVLLTYLLLSIWSTKTLFDELVKSWSDHYVLRQKEENSLTPTPLPPQKKRCLQVEH